MRISNLSLKFFVPNSESLPLQFNAFKVYFPYYTFSSWINKIIAYVAQTVWDIIIRFNTQHMPWRLHSFRYFSQCMSTHSKCVKFNEVLRNKAKSHFSFLRSFSFRGWFFQFWARMSKLKKRERRREENNDWWLQMICENIRCLSKHAADHNI